MKQGEGYNAYDDYDSNVNYYSEGEGVLPLEEALVIASRIPDDEAAMWRRRRRRGELLPAAHFSGVRLFLLCCSSELSLFVCIGVLCVLFLLEPQKSLV